MQELHQLDCEHVGGGEVGATKMGDDYHYTGTQSLGDCMVYEGTKGNTFWQSAIECLTR
ncbi:hypothetical protein QRD43_17015 [Pelomonas sp. APW6]|uniref:Uncharacterized protein n=1 Tax=Roseateles subflavus TaxID=3053353 RepID=A0ABT7LL68_9BURK|nr:hypothetical protein [Pelomonas sp. APW6]MDL5033617.1 hypothetical protein [Pelomonas sp. APW6]